MLLYTAVQIYMLNNLFILLRQPSWTRFFGLCPFGFMALRLPAQKNTSHSDMKRETSLVKRLSWVQNAPTFDW
jgi:hypothetical protein